MGNSTRRHFLRVTAIGTAGFVLGCGKPGALLDDGGTPDELDGGTSAEDGGVDAGQLVPDEPELVMESFNFALGLASGDVEATRAVLWTRVVGASQLRLRVWRMEGDVYAERVADESVSPGDGGFVHLDVSGLIPGTRYRYAFFEENAGQLGARSAIGRFRAALGPGALEPLLFGASSCTQQGTTPTPLGKAGERTDLDLFLLLGDTSYNDGANSLSEFRTRWAANFASPEYRKLRASTSVLATWDDHEVDNNFNPETIDATKFGIARSTFFESLPLRRDTTSPDRLWKSVRWGDTAEFFVLDGRGERKPSTRTGNNPHIYLSREQLDWLKTGLKNSTAKFKVILNSVPITDFGFSVFTGDGWVSYPQQRTEILSFIETETIHGVLWVSGDHHFASVGAVSLNGRGANALEVLAGPGAQSANPAHFALRPPRWPFATGTNNYTTFGLNPTTGKVRVTFLDGNDRSLFSQEFSP